MRNTLDENEASIIFVKSVIHVRYYHQEASRGFEMAKQKVVPPNAIIYNFGVRASNLEFRTRFEFLEETHDRTLFLVRKNSPECEVQSVKYEIWEVRTLRRIGIFLSLSLSKASRDFLITNINFCLSIWESCVTVLLNILRFVVTVVKRSLRNFLFRIERRTIALLKLKFLIVYASRWIIIIIVLPCSLKKRNTRNLVKKLSNRPSLPLETKDIPTKEKYHLES